MKPSKHQLMTTQNMKVNQQSNVITIAQQCSDCGGNGFHIHDSCDHRGEHVQDEWTCETCEGSGLKDGV